MSNATSFPYPIPDYGAEPFWQGCNDGRLMMQRCSACGRFRWHPSPLCTHCGVERYTWEPLSGRGRVFTWTVVTHPVHPAAVSRVPYVVAEIELEEQPGLRIISNLVAVDPSQIVFDAPVMISFVAHAQGQMLPVFRMSRPHT